MKILSLVQGSDEWLAARAKYRTASEAPSMMGVGKVSRSELLRMKATGDEQEFSRWVLEVLFPSGHEVEALARPIAEGIIGEELFPVTAVDDDGFLLASYDGLTMCETICWECKMWNAEKAADVGHGVLPKADFWQVVQQLLVSGAEKCLYMVTDGTSEKTAFLWVEPDAALFDQLLASWSQFGIDLASYVPQEVVAEPVGRSPDDLPALLVQVTGAVTASNLDAFREHALAVFEGISADLSTDSDFADAEKTVKWCKSVEDKLDAAKEQALAQTATIDELFRTIDAIKSEARFKRLELDKLVKARKVSIRAEIINEAKASLDTYLHDLNAGFVDRVSLPSIPVDFAGAMKGKRTIASLRDAVDTELARVKVEGGRIAGVMLSGLMVLKAETVGYESLFADRQSLVMMDCEHLRLLVKGRIADFQAEQDRMLAEQEKEAEAKRLADEERELAATKERETKSEADRRLKELADRDERELQLTPDVVEPVKPETQACGIPGGRPSRPTDLEIIEVLVDRYGASFSTVRGWLADMQLREVA